METNEIATLGYVAGILGFSILFVLFLGRWRRGYYARHLGRVCAASVIWACVLSSQSLGYVAFGAAVVSTEWIRGILWIVVPYNGPAATG